MSKRDLRVVTDAILQKAATRRMDILDLTQLQEKKLAPPKYIVEGLLTGPGTWQVMGPQKSGKTILAVQLALDYHAGRPFLDEYKMRESRAALIIEQDDPGGLASIQSIVRAYPGITYPDQFLTVNGPNYILGEGSNELLERQIRDRDIGLVVLDSYTAMRGHRQRGGDVVKEEMNEFGMLNVLAKRANCLILIVHHPSNAGRQRDWDAQGAGTYAIGAAVDGTIRIGRFGEDLPGNAPERLLQVRPRHGETVEMVLRFCKETLSYKLVLASSAAANYPDILALQRHFRDRSFSPAENETMPINPGVGFRDAAGAFDSSCREPNRADTNKPRAVCGWRRWLQPVCDRQFDRG
jgi:hypothetical protein